MLRIGSIEYKSYEAQVKLFDNAVSAYKNGELTITKLFEKDIFLFDTYVAGTTHIEGI